MSMYTTLRKIYLSHDNKPGRLIRAKDVSWTNPSENLYKIINGTMVSNKIDAELVAAH